MPHSMPRGLQASWATLRSLSTTMVCAGSFEGNITSTMDFFAKEHCYRFTGGSGGNTIFSGSNVRIMCALRPWCNDCVLHGARKDFMNFNSLRAWWVQWHHVIELTICHVYNDCSFPKTYPRICSGATGSFTNANQIQDGAVSALVQSLYTTLKTIWELYS